MDQADRMLQKMDEMSKQLAQIHTDLAVMKEGRLSGEKTLLDHEARIRHLERERFWLSGATAAVGAALGWLVQFIFGRPG
jgi:hypothetical protein